MRYTGIEKHATLTTPVVSEELLTLATELHRVATAARKVKYPKYPPKHRADKKLRKF